MVRMEGLSWDEENEDHIAKHGVRLEEVYQVVQDIRYCRRQRGYLLVLEVWPESHWPGFALRQADVFQSYTAW